MDHIIIDAPYLPIGSGVDRTDTKDDDRYHLTEVIKYVQFCLGTDYKGKGFDNKALTMDVGFLWERTLERTWGDAMALRIGEVECDDILGSPDGLTEDDDIHDTAGKLVVTGTHEPCLEEYKFTWKSAKKSPTEDWYYMTQIKSYCHMIGVNICVMRILYIMGDYKGSGPIYRVCRIVFEEEELTTNWGMILKYAEDMRNKGVKHYGG